jgi:nitronate monooxygenase
LDVLDTVKVPVIMGAASATGAACSGLAYGADGVLMGTRFLASSEAQIAESLRDWMSPPKRPTR